MFNGSVYPVLNAYLVAGTGIVRRRSSAGLRGSLCPGRGHRVRKRDKGKMELSKQPELRLLLVQLSALQAMTDNKRPLLIEMEKWNLPAPSCEWGRLSIYAQ